MGEEKKKRKRTNTGSVLVYPTERGEYHFGGAGRGEYGFGPIFHS